MKKAAISLQNKDRPELGWAKIELPATEEEINAALADIDIPYASPERNCVYSKPEYDNSPFDMLNADYVNADELNYLAMRLDSFDKYEIARFQAAAYCEDMSDIEELINLTFNVDNYTVVTDFSDFAAIGKKYYLDEHTAVTQDEFDKINAAEIGYNLLQRDDGIITPFGVVYKHGKEFETPYHGTTFPQYNYLGETLMRVGLISAYDDMGTDKIEWLELPVPDTCIEKAAARLGADKNDIYLTHICPENIPDGIMQRINTEKETLWSLNEMCRAIDRVNFEDCNKLDAACDFAEVCTAQDIAVIAENIEYFNFYPNVRNADEYGMALTEQAGTFQYDQSLAEFFDYKALGESRMAKEYGRFSDCGYTVFQKAPEVLDKLLLNEHQQNFSAWLTVTESSRYKWVEDEIYRLNGRGAMYYTGGENGIYMRIDKNGTLEAGNYEGAYPHIGEAAFMPAVTKKYGSYSEAYKTAMEAGGKQFMIDMFSGAEHQPLINIGFKPKENGVTFDDLIKVCDKRIRLSPEETIAGDYEWSIKKVSGTDELIEAFKYGNWSVRTGFVLGDLAFVEQVSGGNEWLSLKKENGEWKPFDSYSFHYIIERHGDDYCRELIDRLQKLSWQDIKYPQTDAPSDESPGMSMNM